jgi:Ca-activated chloride channel family protein
VKRLGMSGSRNHYLACWTLAFCGFFIGAAAHSQTRSTQPSQTEKVDQSAISVSTELVVLPVNVTDEHGNFLPGLTMHDFQVFEDKQLQNISFFEQQDTPVTVGLLVDHSGSMAPKLAEVTAAASAFAHSSNPQDEMFVVDFSDDVSVELLRGKPFTSDATELATAVSMISASGQTALYDAIVEGFVHLKLGRWEKKALIVVSDGGDNVSRHTFSQVLAMARSSRAVIYAIGLVGESGEEENPRVLARLCKDTGGIAFFPGHGESIADVSGRIARDLREQYILGYLPDKTRDAGAYRTIDVKVSAPGRGKIHVRSRPGYTLAERPATPPGRGAP